MLLNRRTLDGVLAGTVTVALRRWLAPRVLPGSRLRTAIGIVEVTSIERIDAIAESDAHAAGFTSIAEAIASLRTEGELYRIGLAHAGEDPRIALRASTPTPEVDKVLARLDAAAEQPWTRETLELIAARPATPAAELAAALGAERDRFKRRVRRLKELGLTESLEVGYRLSHRGTAYLAGD